MLNFVKYLFRYVVLTMALGLLLPVSIYANNIEFLYNPSMYLYDSGTVRSAIAKLSSSKCSMSQFVKVGEGDVHDSGLHAISAFESELLDQSRKFGALPHLLFDEVFYDESNMYACALVHCAFLPSLESSNQSALYDYSFRLNHTRAYLMKYDQTSDEWVLSSEDNPAYQEVRSKIDIKGAVLVSLSLKGVTTSSGFNIIESRAESVSEFLSVQIQKINVYREEASHFDDVEVSSGVLLFNNEGVLNTPEGALGRYMYIQKEGEFELLLGIAMRDYRSSLEEKARGIPQDGIERLMRKAYSQFGHTYVLAMTVRPSFDTAEYICLLAGASITGAWNVTTFRVDLRSAESGCLEKLNSGGGNDPVSAMFKDIFQIWISEYYRSI
jgi:hypothetical protein